MADKISEVSGGDAREASAAQDPFAEYRVPMYDAPAPGQ